MRQKNDDMDPKGLIRESYRIDGITLEECRSIFLDWALSVDVTTDMALPVLLERYGEEGHPMTQVMTEGLASAAKPKRRGGWRSRPREAGAAGVD